jgi:hypothetical protein
MDKNQFTKSLASIYNRSLLDIVKKKHGNSQEIKFGQLCELVFEYTTAEISEALDISPKTLRKALVNAFPDLATGNKGTVWRVELLFLLGYRRCIQCKTDKTLDDFYNSSSDKAGKGFSCKICAQEANRLQRIEKPEIIKASNRKRKAIVRGALSSDANLDLIKRIYKECPKDYHVDHIIPLSKGGLHHENNLCYLPALLNMQKQAKFPEEVPEIMIHAIYPDLNI